MGLRFLKLAVVYLLLGAIVVPFAVSGEISH
jgi:hypothetical protein